MRDPSDAVRRSEASLAVPRSALAGISWPALPDATAARLLAVQLQLEQSQWWSPERIEALQFEQLREVLGHARRTVPLYAERLARFDPDTILDRDGWARIPILTRRDLQANPGAIVSRAIPPEHGELRQITTSGSTGRAISVLGTRSTLLLWQAITLRDHLWHRRDFGAKLAIIRSIDPEHAKYPRGKLRPTWGSPADLVYRTGPSPLLNTSCTIEEQAEWLARQDPDYLLTTATRARELALRFLHDGMRLTRLREVRTMSEMLAADLRELCRGAWGARVTDMYSSEEIGYMALQCPQHDHYHVQAENVLLEVLDEQGRRCRDGEVGRVVVSTLHNFATPLIRYEIGDYAQAGSPCPCGRGLPVLARVMGRVRNMLRMPGGGSRWPNFMLAKIYEGLPAAQIQIVQTAIDVLELRAVPLRPLSARDEARLIDYMHDWAGPQFRVGIRVVDAIARGPGGKFEEFLCLLDGETEPGHAPSGEAANPRNSE